MVGLGNGVLDYVGDPALRATSWDSDTTSALVLTPRVRQMLRAAKLRRGWMDAGYTDDPGASERYLYRTWAAGAASSNPRPTGRLDQRFLDAAQDAGGWECAARLKFFALAAGYAERAVAPQPVRAAIDFGARCPGGTLPRGGPAEPFGGSASETALDPGG
jgi:hypothetical protein